MPDIGGSSYRAKGVASTPGARPHTMARPNAEIDRSGAIHMSPRRVRSKLILISTRFDLDCAVFDLGFVEVGKTLLIGCPQLVVCRPDHALWRLQWEAGDAIAWLQSWKSAGSWSARSSPAMASIWPAVAGPQCLARSCQCRWANYWRGYPSLVCPSDGELQEVQWIALALPAHWLKQPTLPMPKTIRNAPIIATITTAIVCISATCSHPDY